MREIVFRGKLINGEWMYGDVLLPIDGNAYIDDRTSFVREIIPETVGQYIGLTDKNGKKIFENDIICDTERETYVVKFDDYNGKYIACCDIGNIHDNPELMMKGEEK